MSSRLIRRTAQLPYDHVTWCPLCGYELFLIRNFDEMRYGHIPWRQLDFVIKWHMKTYHPIRYAIWRCLGKPISRPGRWLLTGWRT